MKINLLTFHAALNYGAVFQTYALSKTLVDMGHEVRIIDLRPPWWLKGSFLNPGRWLNRWKFARFQKHYLPQFTKTYRNSADLKRDLPPGDAFIVGSDQVWNPSEVRTLISAYFLEFVPDSIRKISYAASFGKNEVELSQEKQALVGFLLNRFDAISVRENSGVKICQAIDKVPAVAVLDPVFLLSDSDYSSFGSQSDIRGKGLVCYKFDQGAEFIEAVDYMSKALNMPSHIVNRFTAKNLLKMPVQIITDRIKKRKIHSVWIPSPEEWAARFRKASFIFTDSFHGTALAIIFNKDFIVTPVSWNRKRFTRIEELLKELKLESRIFRSYDEIKSDHRWHEPINYTTANKILSRKIKFSLNFLTSALKLR